MESYVFCYHGTTKQDSLAIQQNIDLSKARYRTDFGKGFYLTNNLKQAEQWAIGRTEAAKVAGTDAAYSEPVVVYFQMDIKKLKGLSSKKFEQSTIGWAEFIFNCRKKGLEERLYHDFDYTLGPLADGRTNILVRKLMKGRISIDEFLEGIKPWHVKNSQLALHTQAAIECLNFVGVKEIEME